MLGVRGVRLCMVLCVYGCFSLGVFCGMYVTQCVVCVFLCSYAFSTVISLLWEIQLAHSIVWNLWIAAFVSNDRLRSAICMGFCYNLVVLAFG